MRLVYACGMRCLIALLLFSLPVAADDRSGLYGHWGTAAQCAGRPVIAGGTKLAEPFEVRPGWLRQGQLWCRLSWFPTQTRKNGLFASSQAQCGEDSVNGYRIDFALDADALTLIWDQSLINGPLHRCPPQF